MLHTFPTQFGLYNTSFEHDSCGFGLLAHIDGQASHTLVTNAITALGRMSHRGAIAADGKSGDGCGILLNTPFTFFRRQAAISGKQFDDSIAFAVGVFFLPREDNQSLTETKALLTAICADEQCEILFWRKVPVNLDALGDYAKQTVPCVMHVYLRRFSTWDNAYFNRRLYVIRLRFEQQLRQHAVQNVYCVSLHAQTIVYKALVQPSSLTVLYPDLADSEFSSSLCMFHQRMSTNTLPRWPLAQPFRMLAHNGEINTIQGNRSWARARFPKLISEILPELNTFMPISSDGSDSQSLDNMLEALVMGGMDIFKAMRLLIPPAWENDERLSPSLRAFYHYHCMHTEPWDGPAGIVISDGRYACCAMDRNGLRPARWVITRDRIFIIASEIGVYDYAPEDVVTKGKLGPGEIIAADTQNGHVLRREDIERRLDSTEPYAEWLTKHAKQLWREVQDLPEINTLTPDDVTVYRKLFGLTFEESDQIIRPLVLNAQEATGSMGDDTPMAALSSHQRSLYDYFRQLFAQVTNPPIDPLRERIVMSLATVFGPERNPFTITEQHAARLEALSPILSSMGFHYLKGEAFSGYTQQTISLNYDFSHETLEKALLRICQTAEDAVRQGIVIIILSDRDIALDKLPVHSLMATGAVHHHLLKQGLRCDANIVVETATARDPHHFAALLGCGATAVYPYLAYETILTMKQAGDIVDERNWHMLCRHYRHGIDKGLFKIMSKMGISTMASYRGAQLFEVVGLHQSIVSLCFPGIASRIGGRTFDDIAEGFRQQHRKAWRKRQPIDQGGCLKFVYGEEYHAFHPEVVDSLRKAVQKNDYTLYKHFASLVNNRAPAHIRDYFSFDTSKVTPIEIDKVEPVEQLYKRFDSAGMSIGALSPEAHEALAIAMNRLGGRSNSGEGGEDEVRFNSEKVSKIKQIASGRFGVTPQYLVNAEVLQIKIAQGAKPGEGGQLPGYKVDAYIGKLRHATIGTTLISPPPHHDIYSIEDLSQLIFDLKQVNPDALVSVKLVAAAGVGTIAAGVTKCYADLITISGYDGGTGASPLSSIKYAGVPWELGLSETHQVLRANNLRSRVRIQTDGGLKTGLDVVKAAILGAESFGFGTAPMVALGCKYLRICHLNTCAVGVATQNKTLREEHFIGLPEMVMAYFQFVAQETREWLALLGASQLTDIIGRTDLLTILPGQQPEHQNFIFAPILAQVSGNSPHYCEIPNNVPHDTAPLAKQMLHDMQQAIIDRSGGDFAYAVNNTHRSIGAMISGEIARVHGFTQMTRPLSVTLTGNIGQSFGVWNAAGLHMRLNGDANDYVGKGMAGGRLVIVPRERHLINKRMPVMGNTCLYGATGGELYAAGAAGERFAVRNSGAIAVIEGAGDHCCEYMTGGAVAILGHIGLNFGAGMSGGIAFVYNNPNISATHINLEMVQIISLTASNQLADHLRTLITAHVAHTNSVIGKEILEQFTSYINAFIVILPQNSDLNTIEQNIPIIQTEITG